jgi:hypothetical protein
MEMLALSNWPLRDSQKPVGVHRRKILFKCPNMEAALLKKEEVVISPRVWFA